MHAGRLTAQNGGFRPGQTVWADDTEGLVLERLTFRNNGAAQSINAGGTTTVAARVEMCSFESQLAILHGSRPKVAESTLKPAAK